MRSTFSPMLRSFSWWSASFLAALLAVITLVCASSASAALNSADTNALTSSLNNIAAAPAYDAPPADMAVVDPILMNGDGRTYTSNDYREYFGANFPNLQFNASQRIFLTDRFTYVYSPAIRATLQNGFLPALTDRVHSFFSFCFFFLGTPFPSASDTVGKDRLDNVLRALNTIVGQGAELTAGAKSTAYTALANEVALYPSVLRKTVSGTGAPIVLPHADNLSQAWARERLFVSMWELTYNKPQLVADIGLTGTYAAILNTNGVILLDNNGLAADQLSFLSSSLTQLTAPRPTKHITVSSLLGDPERNAGLDAADDGANIFSYPMTGPNSFPENQFPADVAARTIPVFCSAIAHELNHHVEHNYSVANGAFAARQTALISQAGQTSLQYLRSQVLEDPAYGLDFFQNAPQEFFASLSNEYVTDSAHTLRLALQRFDAGYREPINQLLFFADVYSQGSSTTKFYAISPSNCTLTAAAVQLTRDASGRINGLTTGSGASAESYRFAVNSSGNVTSYVKLGAPAVTPATLNLSSTGTTDWSHWGRSLNTSFDHKAGITQQISNFSKIGTPTVSRETSGLPSYVWSSGTPTASSTTASGVSLNSAANGTGFQITVPAKSANMRTLNLYVGAQNVTGKLEVSISDGSFAPFASTALSAGSSTIHRVFTVNFRSVAPTATLTLKWTQLSNASSARKLLLESATLSGT